MYEIVLRDKEQAERLIPMTDVMMAMESIPVSRKTKSGIREVDMKPLIHALRGEGDRLYATLKLTEQESCKPAMILEGLKRAAGMPDEEDVRILVIRTQLLGEGADGAFAPLETL